MASPPGRSDAISVQGLRRQFGSVHALRGLDFTVPAGSVCGLLGPNGAGKTTAIRILATLARPGGGRAAVAGWDVVTHPGRVRELIGLAGQHAAVDARLTGRENLCLYGRLHHLGGREARRRAAGLLRRFGLEEPADRLVSTYSGGQRRRLDLAASLLTAPSVLLLDEPTTGLDPTSRHQIWQQVRQLAADGTTVLLTTQYLDEADQLADQIVVIDHGAAIAAGTPARLKAAVGVRASITVSPGKDLGQAARALADAAGRAARGPVRTDPDLRTVTVLLTSEQAPTLPRLLRDLETRGVSADDAAVRWPTLDEAFLRLTSTDGSSHAEPEEATV